MDSGTNMLPGLGVGIVGTTALGLGLSVAAINGGRTTQVLGAQQYWDAGDNYYYRVQEQRVSTDGGAERVAKGLIDGDGAGTIPFRTADRRVARDVADSTRSLTSSAPGGQTAEEAARAVADAISQRNDGLPIAVGGRTAQGELTVLKAVRVIGDPVREVSFASMVRTPTISGRELPATPPAEPKLGAYIRQGEWHVPVEVGDWKGLDQARGTLTVRGEAIDKPYVLSERLHDMVQGPQDVRQTFTSRAGVMTAPGVDIVTPSAQSLRPELTKAATETGHAARLSGAAGTPTKVGEMTLRAVQPMGTIDAALATQAHKMRRIGIGLGVSAAGLAVAGLGYLWVRAAYDKGVQEMQR